MPLPLVTTLPRVAPLLFGWLSHFPVPQPLPLVAPLPGASASAIHYTSTFHHSRSCSVGCGVVQRLNPHLVLTPPGARPPPLVDPLLVTAFGIVCRRSRRRIRPIQ